jgi:hypothetical protein
VHAEYELTGANLEILRRAVTVADELAGLEALVRASGPLIRDRDGQPAPNPASQQHRLLSITLARLLAAIQVIGDQADGHDPARPQRRLHGRAAGCRVRRKHERRPAVRHAISVLTEEGWAYTVPGRGTFATEKPPA